MNVHVVKKNETLSGIAAKHGVSIQALLQLNPQITKPNHIHPGDRVILPSTQPSKGKWLKMKFDGHELEVMTLSGKVLATASARSGLPPGHSQTRNLIKEGRSELDLETDYRLSEHEDLSGVGPVPENTYTLKLTKSMKYEKSEALGDGRGWGEGGWWLDEGTFDRHLNPFSSDRSEFFLHHDGGSEGTSGCVGVKHSSDIRQIKAMLISAYRNGQRTVKVTIDYD